MAIVNEHVRLENAHDFDGCIGKFGRPRYELLAIDEIYDGASGVNQFLSENVRAFPDFHFEASRVAPTTDAVVVEGRFKGTHEGLWRGLPGTGRKVDFPMCIIFEFEGETMVNEKVYFDLGTPLRQLGVAVDPNSPRGKLQAFLVNPVTLITAIVRNWMRRLTRRRQK